MDITTLIQYICIAVIPIISGMGAFIMKNILARLDRLEEETKSHISESEVRQVLDDKLDSIKSDVIEIKVALEKLFDLYVNQFKK